MAARQVISLEPGTAAGHIRLSSVLAALFQWDEALSAAAAGVNVEPLNPLAHARMAIASAERALYNIPRPRFWSCEDLLAAKAHAERALALETHSVFVRCAAGMVASIAGERVQAATHYRAALAIDPTCGPALRYLAESQGNAGGKGLWAKTSGLHDVLRTDPSARWARTELSTLFAVATAFAHGLGWSVYLLTVSLLASASSSDSGAAQWASVAKLAGLSVLCFLVLCYHVHLDRRLREVGRSLRRRSFFLRALRVVDLTMLACLALGVLGLRPTGHALFFYGLAGIPIGLAIMIGGIAARTRQVRGRSQPQGHGQPTPALPGD